MIWGAIYLHTSQDIPNYPYRNYTPLQWYYGSVPTSMYISADYNTPMYFSILFNITDSLEVTNSYNITVDIFHTEGYYEVYQLNLNNGSRSVISSGTVSKPNAFVTTISITNISSNNTIGITYKRTSSDRPRFGFAITNININ